MRKLKLAQILLAADAGASDEDIATSVRVGGSTVYRTKQRFVLGNLKAALNEAPRPGASRKACDCHLWTCGHVHDRTAKIGGAKIWRSFRSHAEYEWYFGPHQ